MQPTGLESDWLRPKLGKPRQTQARRLYQFVVSKNLSSYAKKTNTFLAYLFLETLEFERCFNFIGQ